MCIRKKKKKRNDKKFQKIQNMRKSLHEKKIIKVLSFCIVSLCSPHYSPLPRLSIKEKKIKFLPKMTHG